MKQFKVTEKKITLLLFANEYSRDILEDYINEKGLTSYQLINIGKTKGIYSDFCQCSTDSFLVRFKKTILFYKYLCDLSTKFDEIIVIIPCANHLYTGMLISFAQKYKCQIHHVTEGTLNYCKRHLSAKEAFKRFTKKLISIIFFFPYRLSLSDNLNVTNKNSILFCRVKKKLITNAKNIIEVPLKKAEYIGKKNELDDSKLLIVGTHIADSNFSLDFPSLSRELMNLNIPYNQTEIFYLPHPRAKKNGKIEIDKVYNGLKMNILGNGSSAIDVVMSINPKYILALCGSTLFLELQGYQYNAKMIAWGFDEFRKAGCLEANELKNVHVNIGTYSKINNRPSKVII